MPSWFTLAWLVGVLTSTGTAKSGAGQARNLSRVERLQKLRYELLSDRDYEKHVPPAADGEPVVVQVAFNFYKVHSLDLQSSLMTLLVWFREVWTDPRLAYNSTKHAVPFITFSQQEIWTPDIDLYNHEEQIMKTLSYKDATVYPSGNIFWSRPGLLKVLCKYLGLENFPFDTLKCKLEIGGWTLDGTIQDIIPRSTDCGFTLPGGKTGCSDDNQGTGGVESGSRFQDYAIKDVSLERIEVMYDCCPEPWPELIYTVVLSRASNFYMAKMVLPVIFFTYASFVPFWMSPTTGERLGYAITLLLAMVATDIISAQLMPRCSEELWMSILNQTCMLFGIIALFESAIVLYLYHCTADDWNGLLPRFCRMKCLKRFDWAQEMQRKGKPDADQDDAPPPFERNVSGGSERDRLQRLKQGRNSSSSGSCRSNQEDQQDADEVSSSLPGVLPVTVVATKGENASGVNPNGISKNFVQQSRQPSFKRQGSMEKSMGHEDSEELASFRVRAQTYRQAFYILDEDFSGTLCIDELDRIGRWMLGNDWDKQMCLEFMEMMDKDQSGSIDQDEFIDFVEGTLTNKIAEQSDATLKFIEPMVLGFISMVERRQQATVAMWQKRAYLVDQISRYIFFWSFTIVLLVLRFVDMESLAGRE